MRLLEFGRWAVVALVLVGVRHALAFQTASAKGACQVEAATPSEADRALWNHEYADAERFYSEALTANPASSSALAGLVQAELGEKRLSEALALATQFNSEHSNDAVALDALGEVRFRRGEVYDAAVAFNQSSHLDPCSGMTHYDVARYLGLSGMGASAVRELDKAHVLAPNNSEITQRWRSLHETPMTAEQRVVSLKARLENPSLTDEQKEGINASIKAIEAREKGNCELVSPVTETKVPILQVAEGSTVNPQEMYAAGLEVQVNGKKARLEINTMESGLLLSRSVAKSAGLVSELEIKGNGSADSVSTFVTHVDDIKIGKMEFKNCMVHVLEQKNSMNVDGLIGLDVFRDYLVTLDVPGREVRIGPLPKRPDEKAGAATSLATTDTQVQGSAAVSEADRAKDRYVAPEMKDWTPVFRHSQLLIFPTSVGDAQVRLFAMGTASSFGMIAQAAAQEVANISNGKTSYVNGVSGKVHQTQVTDQVSIDFGGVRQITPGLVTYDPAPLTRTVGVEISGIIGFPTLRELEISIDYRDSLVHLVYDPNKGYHGH